MREFVKTAPNPISVSTQGKDFLNGRSVPDTATATVFASPNRPHTGSPAGRIRRVIVGVFLLNAISAVLFIHFVNHPIYDDSYNIVDVHAYATQRISTAAIRANKNPPGPTGFAWMATTVRLIGGEELRDARIGAVLSWILLVSGVLIGARFSQFAQLWCGALLAALLFPHSLESTALVLTEGPALLFAVLGAMVWVEWVSRPNMSRGGLLLLVFGGFSMGLAITCRQYFIALLPAALSLSIYHARQRGRDPNRRWYAGTLLSLAAAILPVLLLILIWRGLTSPGMANGTSYPFWEARVGLNLSRPLVAAFYTATYFLPLTVPTVFRIELVSRWRIAVGALSGLLAGLFAQSLLQPGPVRTAVRHVAYGKFARGLAVGVLAGVAMYSAATALAILWNKRDSVLSQPPMMFAVLVVVFFVVEQLGVGGNIPFYDRYVLQLAPFLGLIAFTLFPRITFVRWGMLAALFVLTQVMLWRFA